MCKTGAVLSDQVPVGLCHLNLSCFIFLVNFHHHPRRHLSRSSTNNNTIQNQEENFRENDGNDFGQNQNNSHRIVYHSIQIRGKSSMTCNPPTNNLLNSKSDIFTFCLTFMFVFSLFFFCLNTKYTFFALHFFRNQTSALNYGSPEPNG